MFSKRTIARVLVYLSGLCILALGLTLSTKADLGVSPIIAVSFCISKLTGARFGDMTFILYASFVIIEMLLHLIPGKRCPEDRKKAVLADALQLPLSYFFTMLLNILSAWIPAAETMPLRITILLISVILVGTGAALSLDMRIVANPGDGLVQAVSDRTGINLGLAKNIIDISCVSFTCILSMAVSHRIIGVGIGTLIAMLGIGRVIALVHIIAGQQLAQLVNADE